MEEFEKALKRYIEKFGEGFPMAYFASYSPDKVIKIIDECIQDNKDVFENGYIDLKGDVEY